MAIGNWNAGGPSSGASGALGKVRKKWETLELATTPPGPIDWMQDGDLAAPIARMVEALLAAQKEVGPNWSIQSLPGTFGFDYLGGFYEFKSGAWTVAAPEDVGVVDNPHDAHAMLVMGTPHVDNNLVVQVKGNSVGSDGSLILTDTELIDTTGSTLNQYFETTKRWVGQVRYSKYAGTASSVNVGLCRYYTRQDERFVLDGFDIFGRAIQNDSDVNIHLIHHRPTGWTFQAGSEPSPPTVLDMVTDYGVSSDIKARRHFGWRRSGLDHAVDGAAGEGILFRVTTSVSDAIQHLNVQVHLG